MPMQCKFDIVLQYDQITYMIPFDNRKVVNTTACTA